MTPEERIQRAELIERFVEMTGPKIERLRKREFKSDEDRARIIQHDRRIFRIAALRRGEDDPGQDLSQPNV